MEDYPAHYVSSQYVQYGVYDYDSGEALPKGYRVIYRYIEGKFLVVMKNGPYNHIDGTYDGRHGKFSIDGFRDYVENLMEKYNNYYNEAKKNPELCKLDDNELEKRILNMDEFNRNPFDADETVKPGRTKYKSNLKDTKKHIIENYKTICFGDEIAGFDSTPTAGLKYCLSFSFSDSVLSINMLSRLKEKKYLCSDGYIRASDPWDTSNCFFLV